MSFISWTLFEHLLWHFIDHWMQPSYSESLASTKATGKKNGKMEESNAWSLKPHSSLVVEGTVRSDLCLKVRITCVPSALAAHEPHEEYLCGHRPPWHTFQPNELPEPFTLPPGAGVGVAGSKHPLNRLKEKGVWCEEGAR